MQPQGPAEAIEMSEPGGVLPDQVGLSDLLVQKEKTYLITLSIDVHETQFK